MARTAGLRRNFPTFFALVAPIRWVAASRRRIAGVILAVLAAAAAPPLWWATQLVGLPDIGEPFDVAAFRAETIPEDRNAFALYKQALAKFQPRSQSAGTQTKALISPQAKWSGAGAENHRWLELNREALELLRRGAERPDALDPNVVNDYGFAEFDSFRGLELLALLDASRLQEQGDMAGAWGWYRAILRMLHHASIRAPMYRRMVAQTWHDAIRERAAAWAFDPRTTPAQIRQALDDVLACEAMSPIESYSLKLHYLQFARSSSRPGPPRLRTLPRWLTANPLLLSSLYPEQVRSILSVVSFLRRDEERVQRLIKLLTANRLAYYDLPPERRPKPEPSVMICELYKFGPEARSEARALSPEALGRWLESSDRASEAVDFINWWPQRVKEVVNHRALVLILANQLYRRDHGDDPPKPEALVGPYLKSLPPEYPDQGRDEALPVEMPAED